MQEPEEFSDGYSRAGPLKPEKAMVNRLVTDRPTASVRAEEVWAEGPCAREPRGLCLGRALQLVVAGRLGASEIAGERDSY